MRMAIIVLILLAITMRLALNLKFVPIGIIMALPIIAFSLFLNLKGKVNFSVFITSLIFPLYFTFLSVFAKLNGEGLTIIYSIAPRFGIIIMTVISFAVLGFGEHRKALITASFGMLVFIFFNHIHEFFGIDINSLALKKDDMDILFYGLGALFFFFLMITSILQKINKEYEALVTKQRDELVDKNDEITAQNHEIEAQKSSLERTNEELNYQKNQIIASIKYASYIQSTLLPSFDELNQNFESMLFFVPREIVSGDFYWYKQVDNKFLITAADCTGHGVPGAFVSLLGMTFLNSIIIEKNITETDKILNELRKMIKDSLHQKGIANEQKDGMDMALFSINKTTNILEYSGAQNPLYIIRGNSKPDDVSSFKDTKNIRITNNQDSDYTLIELKPNRMPIGVYVEEKPFSKHEFVIKNGDLIYAFSDGYTDQFGKDGKFMSKRFKNLLLSIAHMPLDEQKVILANNFTDWMGERPQTDDVIVLGVKI